MKKLVFMIRIFVLIAMIMLFITNAYATGISSEESIIVKLKNSNIVSFQENKLDGSRPVIILFPGSNEAFSTKHAIYFAESYNLYSDIDSDVLIVTSNQKEGDYRAYESVSIDVMEYLNSLDTKKDFSIIVDAVSLGGYGGYYFTGLMQANGMMVKELTIADGVINIKPDGIRNLMNHGCKVNIYSSNKDREISINTRNLISKLELDGNPLFDGQVLYVQHGQVLSEAIHNKGLHSDRIIH